MTRFITSLLLVFLIGTPRTFAQDDNRFVEVQEAWDTLWHSSDISRFFFANDYGDVYYTIDQKAYMQERKLLIKNWNKVVKKERRKNENEMNSYFADILLEAIKTGDDNRIVEFANLYVNILQPDDLEQRARVYFEILLPVYASTYDLNEIQYISNLMKSYVEKQPNNPYLTMVAYESSSLYHEMADAVSGPLSLKGQWVSKEVGKKHRPEVILNIRQNAKNALYGVLDQNSAYAADNVFPFSTLSIVSGTDSSGNYIMQFRNMQFKEGISEHMVSAVSGVVNTLAQETIGSLAMTKVGTIMSPIIGAGASVLTTIAISSLAGHSANTVTNSYLIVTLKNIGDNDVLLADFNLTQEVRQSDSPEAPIIHKKNHSYNLYKLTPESGVIFTGKRCYPIVEPSRIAYVTPEYYRIYEGYDKFVRRYNTARSPVFWVFWYPCWPVMTAAYSLTNSNSNNKKQSKVFNQLYSEND